MEASTAYTLRAPACTPPLTSHHEVPPASTSTCCLSSTTNHVTAAFCEGAWSPKGVNLCGKEGEDAGASAHIHDSAAVEIGGVLHDGAVVEARPHAILQHILLVLQHAVIVEVQLSTARLRLAVKLVAASPLLLCPPTPPSSRTFGSTTCGWRVDAGVELLTREGIAQGARDRTHQRAYKLLQLCSALLICPPKCIFSNLY